MDLENLQYLIQNNFWVEQIISNATPILLDYTVKKLNEKLTKKDLLWELLHCLQEAHRQTCSKLNWEYEPEVYISLSKEILNNKINLCDERNLANIFSTALKHPISIDDVNCWLNSFLTELSSNEHQHIREFIKLKLLIRKNQLPNIQKLYLEKFQQVILSNNDDKLLLYQLYIPNKYIPNNESCSRDDLMELIHNFIYGDFTKWSNDQNLNFSDKVNSLFIFGHQCTGKSTLVSKVIYDHYFNNEINTKTIHLISFSDRDLRNNQLTPKDICEYLSLDINCLYDSLLIIDGLDETEWSSAVASDKLENLINDLKEFNCKLIVTSRPNYFFTVEFKNTLEIQLNPFSLDQAKEWLDTYKKYSPNCDVESILQQLTTLSPDIREIILIPYVLYTCVTNGIHFNQITEIARLYDIVFGDRDPYFLTTPYNTKSRNVSNTLLSFEKVIVEISKQILLNPENSIAITFINELLEKNSIDSNKIMSEFLMYQKDNYNYAFMHNSIPSYFIARNLYSIFESSSNDKDYSLLIDEFDYFVQNGSGIPSSVIEFIKYFIRKNRYDVKQDVLHVLKTFLSNNFNDKLTYKSNLIKIQEYYYLYFINIVRLVFAFISQNIEPFSSFDLFSLLTEKEKKQFIAYTKLGESSLDCMKICSFINVNLDTINLQGIDLRGKLLRHSSMKYANFSNSNLSGAYFVDSNYTLCCFDDANCKNTDFTNSILFGCSFKNTRLNGANFTNATLDYADLRGARLDKCKLEGASLKKAKVLVDQLSSIFDFDIEYIKENQIEVYSGENLISDEILKYEFQKQRPISYLFRIYRNEK